MLGNSEEPRHSSLAQAFETKMLLDHAENLRFSNLSEEGDHLEAEAKEIPGTRPHRFPKIGTRRTLDRWISKTWGEKFHGLLRMKYEDFKSLFEIVLDHHRQSRTDTQPCSRTILRTLLAISLMKLGEMGTQSIAREFNLHQEPIQKLFGMVYRLSWVVSTTLSRRTRSSNAMISRNLLMDINQKSLNHEKGVRVMQNYFGAEDGIIFRHICPDVTEKEHGRGILPQCHFRRCAIRTGSSCFSQDICSRARAMHFLKRSFGTGFTLTNSSVKIIGLLLIMPTPSKIKSSCPFH